MAAASLRGPLNSTAFLLGLLLLHPLPRARAQDVDMRPVGKLVPADANVRSVATAGSRAYVYNQGFSGQQLLIVDLSDATQPKEVGALPLDARVVAICPANDRVYLAAGSWGLIVVDVADPAHPRELARHFPGENITSTVAEGTRLFVGNAYFGSANSGVLAFDAADPTNLVLLGRAAGVYPRSIARHDRSVVGSQPGTFFAVDFSDPSRPLPPRFAAIDGDGLDVTVDGGVAYVASGSSGLFAFDLAESPPRLLFRYRSAPAWTYRHVGIAGSRAYLTGDFGGLEVVDLSIPSAPFRIGTFPTHTEAPALALDGPRVVLAAGQEGLFMFDAILPAQLRRIGAYPMDVQGPTLVTDGRAYVPGFTGVEILDVRQPAQPARLGTIRIPAARALHFVGTNLFVNSDFSGLHVVRVSDPSQPWHLGGIQFCPGCHAGPMAMVGTNLIVVDPWGHQLDPVGTLNVLDLRSLVFPEWIGDWDEASDYSPGLAVHGSIAYVAGRRHRPGPAYSNEAALSIVDLSDPRHPTDLGFREPTGQGSPRFVHRVGDHLYVVDLFGVIAIYDVSNPADPREVGGITLRGYGSGMDSSDGYGYVALGDGGLAVLDLSDPVHPAVIARNSAIYAESVTVADGVVYVGGGPSGLHLLSTFAPELRMAAERAGGRLRISVTGSGQETIRLERASSPLGPWANWRNVPLRNGHAAFEESIDDSATGLLFRAAH